jgi:hypothetical protein
LQLEGDGYGGEKAKEKVVELLHSDYRGWDGGRAGS